MLPFRQKCRTLAPMPADHFRATRKDFPAMTTATSLRLTALALGLLIASQASANDYPALLRMKKFAEVEKLAQVKLAQDPANADAMIARSNAIMGQDETRIDEAIGQAEKCVAAHPANGRCHLALGQAWGTKAMIKGIVASMGSAGIIRDSLKKAVLLDPANVDARFTLLDFYMMAPFVVGGGHGKAETFIKETAAVVPEASKLMAAKLMASDGDLAKAEAAALTVNAGSDEDLQEQHEDFLTTLGARHVAAKKFAEADRLLREGQKRYPASINLNFMAARLQQEQGRHKEAVVLLEHLLAKSPRPYVHYRLGKSLQALGDKARAVAAYDKAIASKSGLAKNQRADAEEQLKSLRG
jgi:tetratricopeptide (TPR) repeat protein